MNRRPALLLLLLFLGTLVNVSVSWFLATANIQRMTQQYECERSTWMWPSPEGWPQPESMYYSAALGIEIINTGHGMDEYNEARQAWRHDGAGPTPEWRFQLRRRFGFPLLAMESREQGAFTAPGTLNEHDLGLYQTGVMLRPRFASWANWVPRLPLRPVMPWFIFNSVLYAALLAAPWWFFFWRRAIKRARDGRCLGCGYRLEGLGVCPECGEPIRRRSRASAAASP